MPSFIEPFKGGSFQVPFLSELTTPPVGGIPPLADELSDVISNVIAEFDGSNLSSFNPAVDDQTIYNITGDSAYDFWTGISNSTTNDPTFNSPNFDLDGSSRITLKANTPFINSIHKTNESSLEATFVVTFYTPATLSPFYLFGSENSTSGHGFALYYNSTNGAWVFYQLHGSGSNNATVLTSQEVNLDGWNMLTFSIQKTSNTEGNYRFKLNEKPMVSGALSTFVATTTDAGDEFQISGVAGSAIMPNGCKITSFALLDKYVTELEIQSMAEYYAVAHSRFEYFNLINGAENWLQGAGGTTTEFDFSTITQKTINGITGFDFNESYSRVYVCENHGSEVFAMALSSPGDVTTAIYNDSNYIDVSGTLTEISAIRVSPDQQTFWLADHLANTITTWEMSSAQNVATATQNTSKTFDCSPHISVIRSFLFLNNGLTLQIAGSGTNNVIKTFDLSVPYDISTATEDTTNTFDFGSSNEIRGFTYNSNGYEIYFLGASDTNIRKYDLSEPFNVSTATTGVGGEYILNAASFIGSTLTDIHISEDQQKLYAMSVGGNNLTQTSYTLMRDVSIDAASVPENSTEGTIIGRIKNIEIGTTYTLSNNDGNKVALDDQNNLLVGSTAIDFELDNEVNLEITKTNASYTGSPRVTSITLPVGNLIDEAPAAFGLNDWSAEVASETSIDVTVTSLPHSDATITDIQYQIDSGSWTSSGLTGTGSFTLTGLTTGVAIDLKLRAVSSLGNGPASNTLNLTPNPPVTVTTVQTVIAEADADYDATFSESYPGSGTTFSSAISTPHSGASQTDYNMTSVSGFEPIFTGTAGDSAAYFNMATNLRFDIGANTALIDDFHNQGARDWGIVICLRYAESASFLVPFSTGSGSSASPGIELLIDKDTLTARMNIANSGGRTVSQFSSIGTFADQSDIMIGISYDSAANQLRMFKGSFTTGQLAGNAIPSGTTAAATHPLKTIRTANSNGWGTGGRLYHLSLYNGQISSADFSSLKSLLESRHGRTYS